MHRDNLHMLERTHRPKGLERQFCCFLGWSTFVFLILVLAEGHFGRVGQLPLFTPSCRTPTVIHWMNGLWQVWSSHRLPFNLFQGGLSCKSFGWYLFFASFLFSTGFWNISLHWCDFIPDKILHLVVSKISSLCDFYNIVLFMIILVAILTNFQRMNGTDGLRGTRPTEAVKPIMAPRGFSCLPTSSTTYYLFILIRTALLLYCSSFFFNCYFTSHYLLCLIALPQDLLYDYFFWGYRPLPVVTTPPQLPASKPPIFHPWDRTFSPRFPTSAVAGLARAAIYSQNE